ncbi:MAG: hypoxanthine phosphoribosyltransferase [Deltaproteobacteria bacterium]|jgi:hypoxanthine phosphoribosyltransferase|nr:hypoxanthine phosphoribosyltransferase [Deltaproteobacteria bacterium]
MTPLPDHELIPLISHETINRRVAELGVEISSHYKSLLVPGETLLVIGVLNGAFVFMADLIRHLSVPLEVDFIRLSSYLDNRSSSSKVVMLKDLERNVQGRHVLIIEDIADCGLTLNWLLEFLKSRDPASLKLAVAINKKARRQFEVSLDYVAFEVDDGFLVGYGLDASRRYRELAGIYYLEEKK